MLKRPSQRVALNVLAGGVLGLLIVVAAYVSMGRILIENLGSFHGGIEVRVADALGVPVQIGEMSGDWHLLDPTLNLKDVHIGAPGEAGIRFAELVVRFNALASFRETTPIISQLAVDGLTLQVRRLPDGGWQVAGLPRRETPMSSAPLLALLPYLETIDVTGLALEVVGLRARYLISNQQSEQFELVEQADGTVFSLPLSVARLGAAPFTDDFRLRGRYRGDPRQLKDFFAELYLQLPRIELVDLLPPVVVKNVTLAQLDMSGELWLTLNNGELAVSGVTRTQALLATTGTATVSLAQGADAKFTLLRRQGYPPQLHFSELTAQVGETTIDLNGATALLTPAAAPSQQVSIALRLPQVSATSSALALAHLGRVTELVPSPVMQALETLNPRGDLQQVLVHATLGQAPSLRASSQLVGLSVNAFKGVPGISRLDGLLALTVADEKVAGYIDLHNEQPFSLHIDTVFAEPWAFDDAHARFNFSAGRSGGQLTSGLVVVTKDALRAHGRLHLNLPVDRDSRTWGLELGVENADLLAASPFLPKTLRPELIDWIKRAGQGGLVRRSGLVFHGALVKQADRAAKVHELFFDVEGGTLAFAPDWPPLQDLQASLYIHNGAVESARGRARLWQTTVTDASLWVPVDARGAVDSIGVRGKFDGKLEDGVRLLNETPIAEIIGRAAEGWVSAGLMQGNLSLDIPVGSRAGEPVGVDAAVDVVAGSVFMPRVDLTVSDIDGRFTYTRAEGLNSPPFDARVFDETVIAQIQSSRDSAGRVNGITIDSRGKVSVEDLYDWSSQVLLTQAEGVLDYTAAIKLPLLTGGSAPNVTVQVKSDLRGVAINLPAPAGKQAESTLPLNYSQTFRDDESELQWGLGGQIKGLLKVAQGEVVGGRLHFGDTAIGAVAFDQLRVTGALAGADYDAWADLNERLAAASAAPPAQGLGSILDAIDLKIDSLAGFGVALENVHTVIRREPGAWRVALSNTLLDGVFTVPDGPEERLNIALSYLRLPADDGADEDPFGQVDPRTAVAMNVSVQELLLGDEDYGRWALSFEPTRSGGRFSDFDVNVKGLQIGADAQVDWQSVPRHRSSFKGKVTVPDLGSALQQWGYAPSIVGSNFVFETDIQWPGSPPTIDAGGFAGLITVNGKSGRFVQAEARAGALKLLGIFDFASLARRFRFDFSDIVDEGFSFSKIEGTADVDHGVIKVVEPVVIEGSGGIFRVGGTADLNTGLLDNDMIVTLPLSQNLPWYAAYSALSNPLLGAGVYLAQKIFENQINTMASAKYEVTGTLDEPVIQFVSIFNDSVRKTPAELQPTDKEAAQTREPITAPSERSTALPP